MSASIPKTRKIPSVSLAISIACLLVGCQAGTGRQMVSSRTGPGDEMRITRTDVEYQVTLNGEECLRFLPPELAGSGLPEVEVRAVEEGWQRVSLRWAVGSEAAQDELSIRFDLSIEPNFWWAPHLAPAEGYVVAQHVFRSPTLIVQEESLTLAIVPDLDAVGRRPDNPWFMDYDATARRMWLGMVHTEIPEHVLFTKAPGMTFEPGEVELSFFVRAWNDLWGIRNPWSPVTSFLWQRWGSPLLAAGEPVQAPLGTYVQRTYGDRLLTLQDPEGFFPGWLHPETFQPGPVMNRTPESSISVTFLLALAEVTGDARYHDAALRAMDAVLAAIVPEGNWLDYETYWSCCGWGRDTYLDRKIERNAMHKQNTLSMFWTAEALLEAWRATSEEHYLAYGRRTLDELSMAQQVWQPPFIYVPALGGFGVMNADGEWNDSRETLFAELFLDYYRETGDPALFERGVAALKSGFIMMYCPENPTVRRMWEKVYPWFGPEDYGFTMENYGHVYIDRAREEAFGIDRVRVRRSGQGWEIVNEAGQPRTLRIVYEDGSEQSVEVGNRTVIRPPVIP